MIIYLDKSTLFTKEPDERFSKKYGVPKGTWTDLWRRHKMLGYNTVELCEFLHLKTKYEMSLLTMNRWLWRSEIFFLASPAIKKGSNTVVSSYFGEQEWPLIYELTKNLRSSEAENCKSLV